MARKRTIDPGIWGEESFSSLSIPARLLFVGMISQADDEGRLSGSARELRNRLFPADGAVTLAEIESWRSEVHNAKLAVCYRVGDKTYIQILAWETHQTVRWHTASKIPAPSTASVEVHHEISKCAEPTSKILPRDLGSPTLLISTVVGSSLCSTKEEEPAAPPPVAAVAKIAAPPPAYPEDVVRLHATFLEATGRRPAPVSPKHAAIVAELLAWAGSYEAAERGVRKVGASAWHRGENEMKKRHDTLESKPFRTSDAFRGWCEEPLANAARAGPTPRRETPAEKAHREMLDTVFGKDPTP